MEQQAKERLTGGVILVALLVLLVPELLTGPRTAPPPTQTQPDRAPMRSYTLDLGDSPRANSAPVAPSTAAPAASEPEMSPSSEPARVASSQPVAPAVPKAAPAEVPVAAPVAAVHPRLHVPPAPAAWTVQMGTFSSRENAARLLARLKSHGFSGSIAVATKNGHPLFRVRVGAERDRAAAVKLLARLKAAGERGGQIVPR